MKNTPHWAHEDEPIIGERVVFVVCLIVLIAVVVGWLR